MNKYAVKYCTRQSFLSLSRNFWLAVITAGMIAVSLAILGGFLLMAVNVNHFIRNLESNVEISVFLGATANIETISGKLDMLDGVEKYTFVSKEQGLEQFSQTLGDKTLLSGLEGENNPLPDMFRVRVTQAELVPLMASEIQTYAGVEVVDYGKELVGRLVQITRWINTLFLVVGTLIALGAVFLIVTIVRLSVLSRQEEVGVMKYLGASNWFIRFPFLLEGMVMGWLGTLFAVLALGLAYYRLASSLQQEALTFFLQPVTDVARIFPIFAGLLVLGTLMGGFGSFVSVRKYLRV